MALKKFLNPKSVAIIGASSHPEKIGWLLAPSTSIENILQGFRRPEAKIQIIDTNQHIRASYGSLRISENSAAETISPASFSTYLNRVLSPLYRLFTEPLADDFADAVGHLGRVDIGDGSLESARGQHVRGRAEELVNQLVVQPLDVVGHSASAGHPAASVPTRDENSAETGRS